MKKTFVVAVMIFLNLNLNLQAATDQASDMVRRTFNLDNMNIDFDEDEIRHQSEAYKGRVPFQQAALLAMGNLIHARGDEGMDSLLSMIIADGGELVSATYLHGMLNYFGTTFGLVKENSDRLPEHGESLAQNWVFYLVMDNYEHTFWVVVDRAGQEATYNYGFN